MLTNEKASEVSVSGSGQDRGGILDLYSKIRAEEAKLAGFDGKARELPPDLYSFLTKVLGELKAGKSVTIVEINEALTTMEAARILGVSRQFLVQLLEQAQIPFHMVGTHRRVYARDLLAYKEKRDAVRRKALDDLVRAEWEDGTYDAVPLNALIKE
jgi:excisionase family DNA binding protein